MVGKKPSIKQLACTMCGSPMTINGFGQTRSIACPACATVLDLDDPNHQIIQAGLGKQPYEPMIPLGTKGVLFGKRYQMIGYMIRTDGTGMYEWEEYLLFNPYRGFRWLVQMNGHWMFVTPMKEKPKPASMTLGRPIEDMIYNGVRYKAFLRGEARVRYVMGEFYWQVKVGDMVDVRDYVAPPYMLSWEGDQTESVWSRSEYIEPDVVNKGFNLNKWMPGKHGIAPAQPLPGESYARPLYTAALMATIGLFFVQCSHRTGAPRNMVAFSQEYVSDAKTPNNAQKSHEFILPGSSPAILEVSGRAPVMNNWIDLEVGLINAATGEPQVNNMEISYYTGRDSDGTWSEGSQSSYVYFYGVKPGRYYLTVEPENAPTLPVINYGITARYGVTTAGNLVVALFLALVFPVLVMLRRYFADQARWQESG
jgi:hypothetical protein